MTTWQGAWTWACEDRDVAEWHQGCPWCAVWVILPDDAQRWERWQRARDALQPWLWPRYVRQPHITVAYRGLMAGPEGHPAAQWGRSALQADLARLRQLALAPMRLELQGCGSFSTVPFLGVQPLPQLQRAHEALAMPVDDGHWRYVPHVTLGHYRQVVPMAQVQARLQAVVGPAPWAAPLAVERLTLVRYRSAEMAGPLAVEGHWDLRTQQYQPHPQAVLQP